MGNFEVLKDEEMASLKGGYWMIDPETGEWIWVEETR